MAIPAKYTRTRARKWAPARRRVTRGGVENFGASPRGASPRGSSFACARVCISPESPKVLETTRILKSENESSSQTLRIRSTRVHCGYTALTPHLTVLVGVHLGAKVTRHHPPAAFGHQVVLKGAASHDFIALRVCTMHIFICTGFHVILKKRE